MRSTVKKRKKKEEKKRSRAGACRVKSPNKSVASRYHGYPISKAVARAAHSANVVDQSQMLITLLKALATSPARFYWHAEKKKKKEESKNRILQLFELVSLLISPLTMNLQGSVRACARQMAFKTCSCWSRLWRRRIFFRTLNDYERSWTPLWVVKDDYWRSPGLCILDLFVIHFSRCRSHFRLRREGGGKVPYESSFVCTQCANFWDDPLRLSKVFHIFACMHCTCSWLFRPAGPHQCSAGSVACWAHEFINL